MEGSTYGYDATAPMWQDCAGVPIQLRMGCALPALSDTAITIATGNSLGGGVQSQHVHENIACQELGGWPLLVQVSNICTRGDILPPLIFLHFALLILHAIVPE